jgi:hypothetical protein
VPKPLQELGAAFRVLKSESIMSVVKVNSSWDALVPDYPAPLCAVCNIPKWVNKRYLNASNPFRSIRVGYECRLCAAKQRLADVWAGTAQDADDRSQ